MLHFPLKPLLSMNPIVYSLDGALAQLGSYIIKDYYDRNTFDKTIFIREDYLNRNSINNLNSDYLRENIKLINLQSSTQEILDFIKWLNKNIENLNSKILNNSPSDYLISTDHSIFFEFEMLRIANYSLLKVLIIKYLSKEKYFSSLIIDELVNYYSSVRNLIFLIYSEEKNNIKVINSFKEEYDKYIFTEKIKGLLEKDEKNKAFLSSFDRVEINDNFIKKVTKIFRKDKKKINITRLRIALLNLLMEEERLVYIFLRIFFNFLPSI